MAIDWTRGDLYHSLRVLMIDPKNFENVRGELRGTVSGKVDLQYYGDTRMGAELETRGAHGWDGSAALRLIHSVRDYTGLLLEESLFTGFVTAQSYEGEGESRSTSWTLKSGLYALESARSELPYSVAKGSKAKTIISKICSSLGRPLRVEPSAHEYVFGSNHVYDAGSTYLSIVLDMCSRANNRLSVDADGIITVSGYVVPSTKSADYDALERSDRGTVIGPIKGDATGLDAPSRVIVRGESGEENVTGYAMVASGAPSSQGVRGYRKDRFESVTDLSPFTSDAAKALAQRYLTEDLSDVPSISHGLLYRPLREGAIERLTQRDGSTARWMVSGGTLDLTSWTWDLDLKGGWPE